MQLYSHRVWDNQTRQKQPWWKTQRISALLNQVERGGNNRDTQAYYSFKDAFTTDQSGRVKKSTTKITKFSSFDAQVCYDNKQHHNQIAT